MAKRRSGTAKSATEIVSSSAEGATAICFCGLNPCFSNSRRNFNSNGEPTPAEYASSQGRGSSMSPVSNERGVGGDCASSSKTGIVCGQAKFS